MPKEPGINSPLYEPSFHIVLHQPEIPPNTGAIGRTCVALQAKLWLVRPLGFQVDEKTLRRAGLDYWQYLEWEVVNDWAALLSAAQGLGATPERGAPAAAAPVVRRSSCASRDARDGA